MLRGKRAHMLAYLLGDAASYIIGLRHRGRPSRGTPRPQSPPHRHPRT